jgi:hypothetical protein
LYVHGCPLNAVNIYFGNIILFLIIWCCNVADKMNERQRRKSSSESSSESVKLVILKRSVYNALPTPSVSISSK